MGVVAHTLEVELQTLECIKCGVAHAIPVQLYKSAARDGGWWYCPNGHSQGWENGTEHTRIKQLERALEDERIRKTQALSDANSLRTKVASLEKASESAAKRAAAGTCPCCKRTFQQLARHMKCKHPNYGKGAKK